MFLFQPDFGALVRTLTGFGTAMVPVAQINQSLAANATFVLAPIAGKVNVLTVAAVADASGSVTLQFTDGTNTWTAVTVAAGTTGGQDITDSTANVFWQIHNNSATVAAHYFYTGFTLVQ